MYLKNNIYQPLNFFKSVELRERFLETHKTKVFKPLYSTSKLPPFQIRRTNNATPFDNVKLVAVDSTLVIDLLPLIQNDLEVFTLEIDDILVHYGDIDLGNLIVEGEYYLEVGDWQNTWYSVNFDLLDFDSDNLINNHCDITRLSYFDKGIIGGIFYDTLPRVYENVIFFKQDIGKPEYEYIEEGEEDGLGNFSPDYKKLSKKYLLQSVLPEYFLDAINLIPLHNNISIQTSEGHTADIDTLTVSNKWEGEIGTWGLVDLVFTTDFIIKTNCSNTEEVYNLCLKTDGFFIAKIDDSSDDYTNKVYTSALDNTTKIPLETNDLVLIVSGGVSNLKTYDGTNFINYSGVITKGDTYGDLNEINGNNIDPTILYFYKGSNVLGFSYSPEITYFTYDNVYHSHLVNGDTYTKSAMSVEANVSGDVVVCKKGVGSEFNTTGLFFDLPNGADKLRIKVIGNNGCEVMTSDWFNIVEEGIGSAVVETNFIIQ